MIVAVHGFRRVVEQPQTGLGGRQAVLAGRAQGDEIHGRVRHPALPEFAIVAAGLQADPPGAVQVPDRGVEQQFLPQQPEGRELPCDQRLQLVPVQLAHVVGVARARRVRVHGPIGGGQQQEALRAQHAAEFAQQLLLGRQVLEGLEGHHPVEAAVFEGQPGAVGDLECEVCRPAVAPAGVLDGLGGGVDAGDGGRGARQQGAAVALAAGGVENLRAGGELGGKRVAVKVLVPDLALAFRREAFARKLQ